MQHVALYVDTLDEVLTLRDRIRSRGVQVIGPIDHGFIKSIYFGGPDGLNLEVCCGHDIDADAWVDPEVVGLCDISMHEVDRLARCRSRRMPQTSPSCTTWTVAVAPGFGDYQSKTSRVIPLFELQPSK